MKKTKRTQEFLKKQHDLKFLSALFLILIGAVLRVLPHFLNFTPIVAIALFSGVYFSRKKAFIIPIMTMIVSDFFIGFYEIELMVSVYGSFLLCVFLGFWLKKHKKWYTVIGSSVLCSILFFLITNFSVWAFTSWYAKSFPGLLKCFVAALPFFRNSLLGNVFYVGSFFGIYEITKKWIEDKPVALGFKEVL